MPVFDTESPDGPFEGHALLAALLHPTPAARAKALRLGRRRAARAAAGPSPHAMAAPAAAPGTAAIPAG